MHGGDADEFIDYMNDGEASVRHRSFVYRFSGLKYHAGRHQYRISIEKYRFTKEPFEDFMELVYHYESEDAEDVLNHHGSLVDRKAILHIDDYEGMTEEMERRLWIRRSYAKSVRQMIDMEDPRSEEEQIEQAERKYGEITMPKTSGDTHWLYSDQLGLFKERKG